MITTVTPNPARDMTYRVPRLDVGASHRLEVLGARAGGKGMNCAGVLASMRTTHRALAVVGEADQAWWEDDATDRGIETGTVLAADPYRVRLSAALVHDDHEVTVLNEPGVPPPPQAWRDLVESSLRHAGPCEVIAWCGSLPDGAPVEQLTAALARGAESGAHLVVDGSGPWLRAALTVHPAVVTVNRQEACAVTALDDPLEAALRLCSLGARAAVVSDGPRGVVLALGDDGGALRARLPDPLSGNPTGAGDAMTAALCARLHGQALPRTARSWTDAIRTAVAWSGAAVLAPVAGVVDPDDVRRLQETVRVDEIG